jgi:hypothetical protein
MIIRDDRVGCLPVRNRTCRTAVAAHRRATRPGRPGALLELLRGVPAPSRLDACRV